VSALSLDDLGCAGEDHRRQCEVEFLSGLQVDDEIKSYRLLNGQVAGFGSLQDAIDILGRSAEVVCNIRPVENEAAIVGVFSLGVDGWQTALLTRDTMYWR